MSITKKLNSARTRLTLTGTETTPQKMDAIARKLLPGAKKIAARTKTVKGSFGMIRIYKVS